MSLNSIKIEKNYFYFLKNIYKNSFASYNTHFFNEIKLGLSQKKRIFIVLSAC
ncbi:hypothetical protein N748_17015 [Legionella pneumophila str. 121004]|nr:hypothetical protein LPE509_03205 [Legionella pneumophila subsp. pneumophila LPE509]ERB39903.1 hypothetical protein N748_17015 [Legionella pneumophila str. 121004]ERH42049.1 hypothetical protein N750_15140 [Legionella pneumophila str. Leg01/53]ERH46584.1 hypothetical protein N751_07025 [Legionella pneumophila str. Leg01/11]ERI48675.1 hypothetical protein N749_08890 [Legionella pneumophila str. Leg01/20]